MCHFFFLPMVFDVGTVVKIDERGRLVVPANFRSRLDADYFEVSWKDGKLVLSPVPDPLRKLRGKVSRAGPRKDLGEAAEEEALRVLRED